MKIILKKILFRTFIIFLIFNTLQPKFLALLKKCKSMGKILKINELDISKFFRIFLALAPYFFFLYLCTRFGVCYWLRAGKMSNKKTSSSIRNCQRINSVRIHILQNAEIEGIRFPFL